MIRVASAAVLIALVLVVIWWLPWWATLIVAALAAAMGAVELAALSAAAGVPAPRLVLATAAALACVAFVLEDARAPFVRDGVLAMTLVAITLGGALVVLASGPPAPSTLTRAAVVALAPLAIGLPLGALAWTRAAMGPAAVTWLLAVIATSDSAQYYTGRRFGRRRLAPAVSPAKTVEGAIGGLVAAALVGGLAAAWVWPGRPVMSGALLALVLAAAGLAGDLFESLLKRSAGVKDSSALIPGHGGVLDRTDSYLFAAPVFFLLSGQL